VEATRANWNLFMQQLCGTRGRVAVLGGYSLYGQQICHYLAKSSNVLRLMVAGRDMQKAARTVHRLHSAKACYVCADIYSLPNFRKFIYDDYPAIVINTQRDIPLEVAKISLEMGSHYLDLTDSLDRAENADILKQELRDLCEKNNVMCITNASLNPGLTSAIVQSLGSEMLASNCTPQSAEIYITPDEGLAQDVFNRVGLTGGFRSLTMRGNSYYGQIAPGPLIDNLSHQMKIPEIKCFHSFHSNALNRALQVLSYFPGLDKDRIFQEIHSRTSLIERQEPAVEIALHGIDNSSGEAVEKTWSSSDDSPYLSPACLSSIPVATIAEKILQGELHTQEKVLPCINLFSLDEIKTFFPDTTIDPFSSASIHLQEQLFTLINWFELTRRLCFEHK